MASTEQGDLDPDLNFPQIRFAGKLRPSQEDVVRIARKKLEAGNRRLHIVAPPGSGKTVLGLFLWAECVSVPALVLSPNSAIQAQWAARTDLFSFDANAKSAGSLPVNPIDKPQPPLPGQVSTSPENPGLITSLTYQSVTLPKRTTDNIDLQAEESWQVRLIEDGQAEDVTEAEVWIQDLKTKNPSYYEKRLSTYRKKIREEMTLSGNSFDVLHDSSKAILNRLKQNNVGLIILDECHHLMGHWGRVLADVRDWLGNPMVIGLTATPPDRDGKNPLDIERYDEFFGEIDYEVPVPAVVKDGFLAPYQDLAYFVRPSAEELEFVASTDAQFGQLVDEFKRVRDDEGPWPGDPPDDSIQEPNDESDSVAPGAGTSDRSREQQHASDSKSTALPSASVDGTTGSAREIDGTYVNTVSEEKVSGQNGSGKVDEQPLEGGDNSTASDFVSPELVRPLKTEIDRAPSLNYWLFDALNQRRLGTKTVKDWYSFERRDEVFANASRKFLQSQELSLPEKVPSLTEEQLAGDLLMDDLVPVLDRYIRHALRRSSNPEDHQAAQSAASRLRLLGIQVTETGSQACASPVGRVLAYSRNKVSAVPEILHHEQNVLGDSIRAVVVTDFEKSSAIHADVGEILDAESGGAMAAFRELIQHEAGDRLDPILLTGSSVLVDDDTVQRFMTAARTWLKENNFEVELDSETQAGFHVIDGSGGDWCPRVYVEMITELFQQGLTKCLVGTRGLLGEGWDANKINVLVDLTTVTTSMTVNQLRGRSIRLDPHVEDKLANNWDVICIAPEFTKGLDDYRRFEAKHHTLYGVTDDGAIEKGVGHVHAAFTELKPEGIEGSTRLLNEDMLKRSGMRDRIRSLWKIGQPYLNRPIKSIEAKLNLPNEGDFPPFQGAKDPWNAKSLSTAIANAILFALTETGMIRRSHRLHLGERDGGYLRLFLEDASDEENRLFVDAFHEALGPLRDPRYIIPRIVTRKVDTWLSKILPSVVGKFFQKDKKVRVMFHAVPNCLARNRQKVTVFERGWNSFVSPGQAVFTQRGSGEALLAKARARGVNRGVLHNKEIFL